MMLVAKGERVRRIARRIQLGEGERAGEGVGFLKLAPEAQAALVADVDVPPGLEEPLPGAANAATAPAGVAGVAVGLKHRERSGPGGGCLRIRGLAVRGQGPAEVLPLTIVQGEPRLPGGGGIEAIRGRCE